MTKKEFDALDDKWQTIYLDGYTPIRMVSKYSSKKEHILWYDEDECSHTVHYSKVELNRIDRTNELGEFAKGLMIGDYYYDRLKGVYKRVTLDTFYMIKNGNLDIEITPIKLTDKILLDSGFKIVYDSSVSMKCRATNDEKDAFVYLTFYKKCDDSGRIYLEIDSKTTIINSTNINFVHELQHILRICGLNNIDDKLKVI